MREPATARETRSSGTPYTKLPGGGLSGLVLLGVWGISNAAPPTRNTTDYAAMQTQAEAEMANSNARCFASCSKIRNGLKLLVLDQNGNVFAIKHIPLGADAKLLAIGHGSTSSPSYAYASLRSAPGIGQTRTVTVTSFSSSKTYVVTQGGKRYAVTVTTTLVYENGVLIDITVTTSKVPLTPSTELPPR